MIEVSRSRSPDNEERMREDIDSGYSEQGKESCPSDVRLALNTLHRTFESLLWGSVSHSTHRTSKTPSLSASYSGRRQSEVGDESLVDESLVYELSLVHGCFPGFGDKETVSTGTRLIERTSQLGRSAFRPTGRC